jgi:hypothetical protein
MPDVHLAQDPQLADPQLAPDPLLAADAQLAAVPDDDQEYRRRMIRELIMRALV